MSNPRLVIEVTPYQYLMLKKHLEHGMQRKIFSVVIDDMVDMLKEYGQQFIVAMLDKQISYRGYMVDYADRRLDHSEFELHEQEGTN